jgi:hypothetical protein
MPPPGWGRAMAVGLGYSRHCRSDSGLAEPKNCSAALKENWPADSPDGQLARLRPGAGDWQHRLVREFWVSCSCAVRLIFAAGLPQRRRPAATVALEDNNLLPTSRAMRMATSAGGRVAFGWLGFAKSVAGLPRHLIR